MLSRRLFLLSSASLTMLTACGGAASDQTLAAARAGFKTRLVRQSQDGTPFEEPPRGVFDLVRYDAPLGKLGAYLTPVPDDGKLHPAIIWITGGDSNTIGDVWSDQTADNNQNADAYRKAGIVMMFPSLRGGNTNPGYKELMYGELDDVLAAREHLARQKGVDPNRIYLGGHSTGGTLALLTAAYSDRFRAVFAFGAVGSVADYGPEMMTFDPANAEEIRLRSPVDWLGSVKTPTLVIEGKGGNHDSLLETRRAAKASPLVRTFVVQQATHFSVLDSSNRLLAEKILADTGPAASIPLTEAELDAPFAMTSS